MTRHPVRLAAVAFSAVLLLRLAAGVLEFLSVRNLAPQVLGQTYLVVRWFYLILPLLVAALLVAALTHLFHRRRRCQLGVQEKFAGSSR